MIVDAHAHIEGLPGCSWMDPPELMVGLLDEAGIERAIVMTYVDAPGDFEDYDPIDYVARACRKFPARLWGFARLDPGRGPAARELLARCIGELGFKGLKLHPFGYRQPPDSPDTLELVRAAAELRAPVLLHCGDEDYTRPLELARLAKACPKATLIFGHMGGYFHVADAIAVARECPNVLLETSAMPYPERIAEAVEALGPERVLFASDGPGCDPKLEVLKVERSGIRGSAFDRVMGENILELLEKLSPK
ncbi:MAG: amidohydrolase [Candidatus Wallbacteria bacterium]|nr:amidohydrolase [Candidatus Wallbacteria bacterium]